MPMAVYGTRTILDAGLDGVKSEPNPMVRRE